MAINFNQLRRSPRGVSPRFAVPGNRRSPGRRGAMVSEVTRIDRQPDDGEVAGAGEPEEVTVRASLRTSQKLCGTVSVTGDVDMWPNSFDPLHRYRADAPRF